MDIKFDWDDITLVPETVGYIESRYTDIDPFINGKLPLFTAPMDRVIGKNNYNLFNEKMYVTIPRNIDLIDNNVFKSYGINEIEDILKNKKEINKKVLIDVANGHLYKLIELCKELKATYSDIELMVGNIANPKTYKQYAKIGVDYIRVGIGGGSVCTTSANSGVHYPMASLVNECYEIKVHGDYQTKIVADGGFYNFSDIIKALGVGADYVMLGGLLSKMLESNGDFYFKKNGIVFSKASDDEKILTNNLYNRYRGMSTKEVQKTWNKSDIRTSEGIVKYNKVEFTLDGWLENFEHYLRTAMSYTNSKTLSDFKDSDYIFITQNALKRFKK